MKKLFLLLILSFFSAQSFAGSCPDGSEPVKSVSSDGTYYVFICGNSDTSSQTKNLATSSSTQIEWVDGLYVKSIKDEFNVFSKDFSKPGDSGSSMIIPLGSGDFSGDGVPEIVYGISYKWFKDGEPLATNFHPNSGALQLNDIQLSDSGVYRVHITNWYGETISSRASLYVSS